MAPQLSSQTAPDSSKAHDRSALRTGLHNVGSKMTEIAYGPWNLGGLSVKQLLKRVYAEITDDAVVDAAAALGYYFMLALFPLLIFLVSLLGTFGSENLVKNLLTSLQTVMPGDVYKLLGGEIDRIMKTSSGSLLTFGAVATLWAASSGVVSLIDGLNRAYDVTDSRSFVKRRLIALGLTVTLAVLIICGSVMLVMGDKISLLLAKWTGLEWMKSSAMVINFVLGLGLMFAGLEIIYYAGPNVKNQKFAWISPGSIVGVVVFILSSVGFSLYVRFSGGYGATYGSLGAVIVLMLWLFLLGLAIVLGGEINAEIAAAARRHGEADAPNIPPQSAGTSKG